MRVWLFGSYAGIGVLLLIVVWVFKDVRDLIRSGGKDKLTVQRIMDKLDKGAGRTRNPFDDYATGAGQYAADWSADRILAAARQMGWGPQQSTAPAPPATPPA